MALDLPIDGHLDEVVTAVRDSGAAVIVAPPGSGKTTRIPVALLESIDGQIVVLEPRRIAARAAACRIAHEFGEPVGQRVGYHVRFERRAGPRTRLLIVTEGILTRRLQHDPSLDGVGAVILDEFHERNLNADLALALLKEVRNELRPDLRIVVMSATLNAEVVSRFLNNAPIVHAGQSPFELEIVHQPHSTATDIVDAVADGVEDFATSGPGDTLVFLPGVGEILRCAEQLGRRLDTATVDIVPLYGDLPADQQDAALTVGPRRRIVLATNVAETSVTIPGVRTVIDSGWVRQLHHDPDRGLDQLRLQRISRASADQRAGRAARTGPGRVLRLWTTAEHRGLAEYDEPEIHRVDLTATALELRAWGAQDLNAFGWFEAPRSDDLDAAAMLLSRLGAVDAASGRLTDIGRTLVGLPVHPRLGRMMQIAHAAGALREAAVVAALLTERDIVRSVRGRPHNDGQSRIDDSDVLYRMRLFDEARRSKWRECRALDLDSTRCRFVDRVATALERAGEHSFERPASRRDDVSGVLRRALLSAFPDRVVRRRPRDPGSGRMVGGRGVTLGRESVVQDAELYVAVRIAHTSQGGRRGDVVLWASSVRREWLDELPGGLCREDSVYFDTATERVVSRTTTRYHDLTLVEGSAGPADAKESASVLGEAVREHFDRLRPTNRNVCSFLTRALFLHDACPDLGLPPANDDAVRNVLIELCSTCSSFAELRRQPLLDVLRSRWSYAQLGILDQEAPESLRLPGGRQARIRYERGRPPTLSATVQDLLGMSNSPCLARGRVPCLIEVLAPNRRPVQITQDLASFWSTVYPQVRKDLRGRYPKHHWPESP